MMNGSEAKYTSEYVEIQTSLEHIRTKLDTLEQSMRDIQSFNNELYRKVDQNQIELAGVKATAAMMGGMTGSVIALALRIFFPGKA